MAHDTNTQSGYEKSDANFVVLFGISALIIITIMVCVLGVHEMYTFVRERTYRKAVLEAPNVELIEMQKKSSQILSTYGVVDGNRGVYRVPIEKAKELLVQEAR